MSAALSDTSLEAAAVQIDIYRRMTPQRKLEIVEDANRTSRLLALAGLRQRFPDASAEELHLRLFHLVLGTELATAVYGSLPDRGP
jgi:hypothetical protein